ncbi:5598_t:CDS:1, partial [Paraglomus brasilianum]
PHRSKGLQRQYGFSDKEVGYISSAFNIPYVNNKDIVNGLIAHIDGCLHEYNRNDYYAPFTAIVQGSGVGKSRSIKEVAKECYCIYICLRKANSTGYPFRSKITDTLVSTELRDSTEDQIKAHYVSFLIAAIQQASKIIMEKNMNPAKWFRYHVENPDGSQMAEFWNKVRNNMKEVVTNMENGGEQDSSAHKDATHADFLTQCLQKCAATFQGKSISRRQQASLIFVFDEARTMISSEFNYFVHFCRALQCISEEEYVFVLVMDTTSRITNFMPLKEFDPSDRILLTKKKLLIPYVLIGGFDLLVTTAYQQLCNKWLNDDIPSDWNGVPATLKDISHPFWLACLGRSLHGSYLQATKENWVVSFHALMNMLKSKLLGSASSTYLTDQKKLSTTTALAVLGPRLCIDVVPSSSLSSELVASRMAVCTHISEQRDMVYMCYPSEPLLAEASAQLMNETGAMRMLLPPLLSAVRYGLVEGGYQGELVARCILLMAWDETCKKQTGYKEADMQFSRPLRVRDYLMTLLGKDGINQIGGISQRERARFLNGFIFFNHFLLLRYTPSKMQLLRLMRQGVAALCKRNQQGIDAVFGVLLTSMDDDMFSSLSVFGRSKDPKQYYPAYREPDDNLPEVGRYIGVYDSESGAAESMDISSDNMDLENIDDSKVGVVTLQFQNYLHSEDAKYVTATAKVNTTYSQIESKPNAPFLSLYMQLGSNKWKVERLVEDKSNQKRRQAASSSQQKNEGSDESAETREARLKYQMAVAVFGMDYPFFKAISEPVISPNSKTRSGTTLELGVIIKKELRDLLESHPDPI